MDEPFTQLTARRPGYAGLALAVASRVVLPEVHLSLTVPEEQEPRQGLEEILDVEAGILGGGRGTDKPNVL